MPCWDWRLRHAWLLWALYVLVVHNIEIACSASDYINQSFLQYWLWLQLQIVTEMYKWYVAEKWLNAKIYTLFQETKIITRVIHFWLFLDRGIGKFMVNVAFWRTTLASARFHSCLADLHMITIIQVLPCFGALPPLMDTLICYLFFSATKLHVT